MIHKRRVGVVCEPGAWHTPHALENYWCTSGMSLAIISMEIGHLAENWVMSEGG
jgi:hypothetical protein